MELLLGLTYIFSFQLLGTIVAISFNLAVPGPILGLIFTIFWISLASKTNIKPYPDIVPSIAKILLAHLPLLFVPASVGIIQYLDTVLNNGFKILLVLVLSTIIGLIFTALSFVWLAKKVAPASANELKQD